MGKISRVALGHLTLYHLDRSVVSNTLWEVSAALQRVCDLLRVILRLPPRLCDHSICVVVCIYVRKPAGI